MVKLDLNAAADEFEMINSDTHLLFNIKTGLLSRHSQVAALSALLGQSLIMV